MSKIKGMVLLSALLVTAFVSILTTTISQRMMATVHSTQLATIDHKLSLAKLSMIHWAVATLRLTVQSQGYSPINKIHSPAQVLNGIQVTATLEDAQKYFNITNLLRTHNPRHHGPHDPVRLAFARLIHDRLPELSQESALKLSNTIATHLKQTAKLPIDHSSAKQQLKSWLQQYKMGHTNPLNKRTPPHTSFDLPSLERIELRNVPGMTEHYYQRLLPWLTALPMATPINVNTAPSPVLLTLKADINPGSAERVVNARQARPFFSSVSQFITNPTIKQSGLKPPFRLPITVSSQFFYLNLYLKTDKQEQNWQLLLFHDPAQKPVTTYLLNQRPLNPNLLPINSNRS